MNGLKLSHEYFWETAFPLLKRDFPELSAKIAAGLVGNGSECFGFDDELSRDHDWGIDFFIWLSENDRDYIPALSDWKQELFKNNPPEYRRTRSEYGARIGVMTSGEFYSSLIGLSECPQTITEWLKAPEENFALAVNGAVFYDGLGEFTKIRTSLQNYYPEDIWRKKLSARCMSLAQTGQYNHERVARRGDTVTLHVLLSRFIESAVSTVFLLNRVFKPYYKWSFRAMTDLPVLGSQTGPLLTQLALCGVQDAEPFNTRCGCISKLCALFVDELQRQGLTQSDDWFLTTHAEEIRCGILNASLRALPAQYDV